MCRDCLGGRGVLSSHSQIQYLLSLKRSSRWHLMQRMRHAAYSVFDFLVLETGDRIQVGFAVKATRCIRLINSMDKPILGLE